MSNVALTASASSVGMMVASATAWDVMSSKRVGHCSGAGSELMIHAVNSKLCT